MRRLSRRAVWASSLALLIVMSYIGTAQAHVLTTMSSQVPPQTSENRLLAQGSPAESRVEQREATRQQLNDSQDARQENRAIRVDELQEMRDEAKERVAEQREDRQNTRQERRDFITEQHADRLEYRFGVYSDRLSDIIVRLDAKLTELEAAGSPVDAEKAQLEAAKDLLVDADNAAADAIVRFLAIEPAEYETQRAQALEARDLAQTARGQYAAVRMSLQEIIRSLKAQMARSES